MNPIAWFLPVRSLRRGPRQAPARHPQQPWRLTTLEERVTPAVAFNRNMDLVHRVIGRAGVVLVGEGNSPTQLRQMMTDQKRRVGRVAPDTPVYDVFVGDGEGQVPLRKLQQHLMKLPRNVDKKEIGALENRMRALGGTSMPMPKGPMPRTGRVPRGKMR